MCRCWQQGNGIRQSLSHYPSYRVSDLTGLTIAQNPYKINIFWIISDGDKGKIGWGGRIRTCEWRDQNPLPYHLATPQNLTVYLSILLDLVYKKLVRSNPYLVKNIFFSVYLDLCTLYKSLSKDHAEKLLNYRLQQKNNYFYEIYFIFRVTIIWRK